MTPCSCFLSSCRFDRWWRLYDLLLFCLGTFGPPPLFMFADGHPGVISLIQRGRGDKFHNHTAVPAPPPPPPLWSLISKQKEEEIMPPCRPWYPFWYPEVPINPYFRAPFVQRRRKQGQYHKKEMEKLEKEKKRETEIGSRIISKKLGGYWRFTIRNWFFCRSN